MPNSDLRLALRALWRRPSFAATAVLALSLGIGAHTAIFSAVDAIILRAHDIPDPDRVVQVWDSRPTTPAGAESQISIPNWEDYRAGQTVFERFAGFQGGGKVYRRGVDGRQEALSALFASRDLFSILGAQAALGRTFVPEEDEPGAPPTAILSHALWQRLGGDPAIVGQTLGVTGWRWNEGWGPWQLEIVGVLPAGFAMPPIQIHQEFGVYGDADLVLPMGLWTWGRGNRGMYALRTLARLKPGVSLTQARAQMAGLAAGLAKSDPEDNEGLRSVVTPLPDLVRSAHGEPMALLWGGAILVLLIACANAAALTTVRAIGQRRELAIRAALGAGRRRIVRLMLTESLVIGIAGGTIGLGLAFLGTRLISGLAPAEIASSVRGISVNGRVLVSTLAAALATGLLVGLVPALRAAARDPSGFLKEGSGGAGHRSGELRLLVVGQVALAFLLVTLSLLLFGSLSRMLSADPGFEVGRQVFLKIETLPPPLSSFKADPQFVELFRRISEELERRPDVVSVTAAGDLPLSGRDNDADFTIADRPPPEHDRPNAAWLSVPPGYFRSMGIPIVEGREFGEEAYQLKQRVGAVEEAPLPAIEAIVSEPFARRHWPGQSALGKVFYWGVQDPFSAPNLSYETGWDERYPRPYPLRIVGVAAPVNQHGLAPEEPLQFYTLMGRFAWLAVRVREDANAVVPKLREAVEAVDPELTVSTVEPAVARVRRIAAPTRFELALIGTFGALAVVLAGVGLYGALAYSFRQRRRELSVRIALGATAGDIRAIMLRQGALMTAVGLAVGVTASAIASRFLRSLLFGLEPTDLRYLLAAAAVIGLVATLASLFPARRAERVDVARTLREE